MTAQHFHCYTGAYESVYSETVRADSWEAAAVLAAEATGIAGEWTVVAGEPVTVKVAERKVFEAVSRGSS